MAIRQRKRISARELARPDVNITVVVERREARAFVKSTHDGVSVTGAHALI